MKDKKNFKKIQFFKNDIVLKNDYNIRNFNSKKSNNKIKKYRIYKFKISKWDLYIKSKNSIINLFNT